MVILTCSLSSNLVMGSGFSSNLWTRVMMSLTCSISSNLMQEAATSQTSGRGHDESYLQLILQLNDARLLLLQPLDGVLPAAYPPTW
jgi:hypothetical protein